MPRWVPAANGSVPEGAIVAGSDGENLYIARAQHGGALTPGKLHPSHGLCYVSWRGKEHAKKNYQVLCSSNGFFEPSSGGAIPPNAFPAGTTEDGESLYIGRVWHDGTLTPGKVHPSHGVCYISYCGKEIGFKKYEIFVDDDCSNATIACF